MAGFLRQYIVTMSDVESQVWNVRRLLSWTTEHFEKKELDSPRLCAEILLADTLGCPRIALYTQFDHEPAPAQLDRYRDLVRRAALHEPIAYLVGYREFFSLRMTVSPAVLIPRPETEMLVEHVIHRQRSVEGGGQIRVLDMCTGSGCIAVAVAKHLPMAEVIAADISEEALNVAAGNAAAHNVDNRVRCVQGDLFEAVADEQFDYIVTNPPYVSSAAYATLPDNVRQYEPAIALQADDDGLGVIRRIVRACAGHLRQGGQLVMEMSFDQGDAVRTLIESEDGLGPASVYKDPAGLERMVVADLL